jgi:hypothetical protein
MDRRAQLLTSAIEKHLDRALRNRLSEIEAFRVAPYMVTCVKGGFETDVAVFAKRGGAVFFVSLDALMFGAGSINDFGDIIESMHYPNITMAVRSFLGMAREQP